MNNTHQEIKNDSNGCTDGKLQWEAPDYIVKDIATETMGKVPGVGEPTATTGS